MTYVAPEFKKNGFTCPNCNAYARQDWTRVYNGNKDIYVSYCQHCEDLSIWLCENVSTSFGVISNSKMLYPKKSNTPLPNDDLEEEIKQDYLEASNVLNDSPRGACALLRLALQKLMIQLGEDGNDLNKNIGALVKKGLNVTIQQALDSVRVIGNEAVHPGELNLKDDMDTATTLFGLINVIAEALISQPKKILELYGNLPEGKLVGINNRDK